MKIKLYPSKNYTEQLAAYRRGEAECPVHTVDVALDTVNGKARAHTFRYHREIACRVEEAELRLRALGIKGKNLVGTVVRMASGDSLPSAYKYRPIRTYVKVERFPTGWFVTAITADERSVAVTEADRLSIEVPRGALDKGLANLNVTPYNSSND